MSTAIAEPDFAHANMQGWINIKIRSTLNVRPRHRRYCILTGYILSTFKFKPDIEALRSNSVRAVRSYFVNHVTEWKGRKNGLLLTALLLDENLTKVLEIDVPSTPFAEQWMSELVMATSVIPGHIPTSRTDVPSAIHAVDASADHRSLAPSPIDTTGSPGNPAKQSPHCLRLGASIHRGLDNYTGENNCFLNVILQTFWHLRSIRRLILRLNIKRSDSEEINVLCALQDIMKSYQDTSDGSLHPGTLRKGLSELYRVEQAFAEGSMCDAEETLLTLLNLMHHQTVNLELQEREKARILTGGHLTRELSQSIDGAMFERDFNQDSIPHIVFGHQIYDRTMCGSCGMQTDWDLLSNLVFSVCASDLAVGGHRTMESMIAGLPEKLDINRTCASTRCNGKSASKQYLENILGLLRENLDLSRAFKEHTGKAPSSAVMYRFRGTAHKSWLLFDDSRVAEVGPWSSVVDKCLKGRYQPVLLFYEVPTQQKDSSKFESGPLRKQMSARKLSKPHLSLPVEAPSTSDTVSPARRRLSNTGKAMLLEGLSPSANTTSVDMGNGEKPYVPPVSSAVAMQPRLGAMRKVPGSNEYDVEFSGSDLILGLFLEEVDGNLCVTRFPQGSNGEKFAAELSGKIGLFDDVVSANGYPLGHYKVDRAIRMIQAQARPLVLRMGRSTKMKQLMDMGFSQEIAAFGLKQSKGNVEQAANLCFDRSSTLT